MGKETVSRFGEAPKTKYGRIAMRLGLSPILISPFLSLYTSVIRPAIDRSLNEHVGARVGFGIGMFFLLIALAALAAAIMAFRSGERSWGAWAGFIPIAIWIFLIAGELLYSH